jgi:resuscitation-promoting factor RpfB
MSALQRAGVIFAGIVAVCSLGAIGAFATDDPPPAAVAPLIPSTAVASPSPSSPAPSSPSIEKRTVTETKRIPFKTRKVRDSSLDEGESEIRTEGAAGVRTLTYELTITDGNQTAKRLLSNKVTQKPTTKVIVIGTRSTEPDSGSDSGCDPNYSGGCVPIDSDVDCAGGSGNGPSYVSGVVKVTGSDIYDLDRDNDGYGCD